MKNTWQYAENFFVFFIIPALMLAIALNHLFSINWANGFEVSLIKIASNLATFLPFTAFILLKSIIALALLTLAGGTILNKISKTNYEKDLLDYLIACIILGCAYAYLLLIVLGWSEPRLVYN